MKKIILASASPRRQSILKQAGIPFEILISEVEEDWSSQVSPYDVVKSLSMKKALAVNEMVNEPCIIIAADTVVTLHGKIMGKPKDADDAYNILKKLQGRKHAVYTGVTIINKEKDGFELKNIIDNTDVYMRKMSDAEIDAYIATNEPFDKAGAYAIQEKGSLFIEKIEGDYYNVVGLPLVKVYNALQEFGIELVNTWATPFEY